MKINSYTTTTKTEATLPKEFGSDVNLILISQAVHVYRNHMHLGTSKVQTRGEVTARKGKVYRQKGTGNARHGAKSAPIFVGGGKAHGPRGVKKVLELPKKMRARALASALSLKAKRGDMAMFSVAKLEKTRDAQKLVDNIRKGEGKEKAKLTIVLSDKNNEFKKALANVANTKVSRYQDLNAYSVMMGGKLIFDNEIFAKKTEKKTTKKS